MSVASLAMFVASLIEEIDPIQYHLPRALATGLAGIDIINDIIAVSVWLLGHTRAHLHHRIYTDGCAVCLMDSVMIGWRRRGG